VVVEIRDAQTHPATAARLEKNEPFRRDISRCWRRPSKRATTRASNRGRRRLDQQPQRHEDARRLTLHSQVTVSARKGRQRYELRHISLGVETKAGLGAAAPTHRCGTMALVLTVRPHLDRTLEDARQTPSPTFDGWLDSPPVHTHFFERERALPSGADLEACGQSLIAWDVHRGAGLRVAADAPARPGTTVVLGLRLGPLWVVAPCRVIDATAEPDCVGFTYATLPGHPERGVESFEVMRKAGVVQFGVRATSVPAFWGARLVPPASRWVQSLITARYLDAAAASSLAR